MTRSNASRGRRATARVTLAVAAAMTLAPASWPVWSGPAAPSLRSSTAAAQTRPVTRRGSRFIFWDVCHTEPCAGKVCCLLYPWLA